MGPGAEVGEVALLIEGDHRVLGEVVDQLHLVGLVHLLHQLQRLRPGQFKALQLLLGLADPAHFRLDGLEVIGGKDVLTVHVVVEPVVDGGADGKLCARVQVLNGLRHDVAAGVVVGVAVFGVLPAEFKVFAHSLSS